jgi:hypothetical protein
MKIPFKRIWSVKKSDLKQWIYYNIVIGLSPIWLSCLCLAFGKVFSQFVDPFLDGTLLIFTATLSGASMSFFVTETKLNLRKTEQFVFSGLLTAIILGAGGYAAIITLKAFSPNSLWSPMVVATTCITLTLAAYFNLYLAGIRSAYTDQEFMEKLVEEESEQLVERARDAKEVNGAKL